MNGYSHCTSQPASGERERVRDSFDNKKSCQWTRIALGEQVRWTTQCF